MNILISKIIALSLISVISWLSIGIIIDHYKTDEKMALYQNSQASQYIQVNIIE
ncbi:hypothetical protein OAO18_03245 [Francisellaceae bacterium]|nr:hypothetical protein [Francisellaceae bacterium]